MKIEDWVKSENGIDQYYADYVVIGIGAAGALMVNRLSECYKNSVIGIKAGENLNNNKPIYDSLYAGVEFGLEEIFNPVYLYQQTPVRNGSLGSLDNCDPSKNVIVRYNCIRLSEFSTQPENVGIYTTGKVLGGGSSINGEQYVRGTSGVYNLWAQIGGPHWSYNNVVQSFKEIEKYNGLTTNPLVHGYNGPLDIRQAPLNPTTMADKFITALTTALPSIQRIPDDDYNNPNYPLGVFGRWELFQLPDGNRANSVVAFLNPQVMKMTPSGDGLGINGRKLLVLMKSTALRIIWKKNKAIGVEVLKNGRMIHVYGKK